MTLCEAFQLMREAGYAQVLDNYSHFPRDIAECLHEARNDLNDYTPDPSSGTIVQNHDRPSNRYQCC